MTRPYFTPAEDARRVRRVLTEPLILGLREELANLDLIVPADFARMGATHAVTGHPGGVRIRNCRIVFETDTWLDRWALPLGQQPEFGISNYVSGLYLPGCRDVRIDGLHVEGSPRIGIECWDVSRLALKRFSATRCLMGGHSSRRTASNRDWTIDGFRVWDTWGPPQNVPSVVRPGGWMGGDGFAGEMDRATLRGLDFSGEGYVGLKLCRAHDVTIEGLRTNALMVQGSATMPTAPASAADTMTCRGVVFRDFMIDKSRGSGPGSDLANAVQISWSVREMSMLDGYIMGNGRDGNGIQATGDVELDVRGVGFGGFTGTRGGWPAHALELDVRAPESTINADFETANRFFQTPAILRRAA